MSKNYNAKPPGLSEAGQEAHGIIMRVLEKYEATDTGGCTSFYSPAQWAARKEEYGTTSELVVVYDGSDLRTFFNMDAAYDLQRRYDLYEEMQGALEAHGMYFEECTGWYAAVYKR